MATGGTDHMIRVYYLGAETPMKVSELDAHTVKKKKSKPSVDTIGSFCPMELNNIHLCPFRIKLWSSSLAITVTGEI